MKYKSKEISELRKEISKNYNSKHSLNEIKSWYKNIIKKSNTKVKKIALSDCRNWKFTNQNISHKSNRFFKVEALRVTTSYKREINKGWDQPILTETGLLQGVLQQNKYLEFICKNIYVKINNTDNKYFKNIKKEILELHIAHNEGNFFCSNDELKSIEDNNQIAVTYCNKDGTYNDESNPNGALKNIAGIFNKKKNILGMMPHPERMIDKYLSGEDGSIFFENLIGNLR